MAAVVVLVAMGAIFLVSSRCMAMIARSQSIATASALLHERMQQLQTTDWETLTDSESYQDQVWTDPEDGTKENVDGPPEERDAIGSGVASGGGRRIAAHFRLSTGRHSQSGASGDYRHPKCHHRHVDWRRNKSRG